MSNSSSASSASKQVELTEQEILLLSFIEQNYNLTGEFLSAEKALKDFGIPVSLYNRVLNNPSCRNALIEKGITFERFEKDDWTSKSLTPKQLLTANTMLDLTDTRSDKKKLADLGVHTQTFNSWLKDPVFKEYLATRARQMIGDNEHKVDLALLDRVQAGDIKAISYFNEMTGRFIPQRAGNTNQIDPTHLISRIIEIISEEVSNPLEMQKIAARLKTLVTARNVAGALVNSDDEPIVVPEIAPVRKSELTSVPEI